MKPLVESIEIRCFLRNMGFGCRMWRRLILHTANAGRLVAGAHDLLDPAKAVCHASALSG